VHPPHGHADSGVTVPPQWRSQLSLVIDAVMLVLILHWTPIVCIFREMVRARPVRVIVAIALILLTVALAAFPAFIEPEVIEGGHGYRSGRAGPAMTEAGTPRPPSAAPECRGRSLWLLPICAHLHHLRISFVRECLRPSALRGESPGATFGPRPSLRPSGFGLQPSMAMAPAHQSA
jgi:hypothetical protein